MNRFLAIAVVWGLLCVPSGLLAGEAGDAAVDAGQPRVQEQQDQKSLLLAKQGCCSWHGGVCGCSNGRVLCCDNTLSPSCRCRSEKIILEN